MTTLLPLCLLALAALDVSANPLPVPTPPPVDLPASADCPPSSAPPTCTTTLTQVIYGFQGDFTPSIAETVYTATETAYSEVPCHGCALAFTAKLASFWGGVGPVVMVTGTTTAEEPFTTTLTVCAADHTAHPHMQVPRQDLGGLEVRQEDAEPTSETASPAPASECTHTRLVAPTYIGILEKTSTVYTETATSTSHIDCGGCNRLDVQTVDYLNPGPVVRFTTTETADVPRTVTEFVCLKTPSVVTRPVHPPITTLIPQPTEPTATLQQRDDDGEAACSSSSPSSSDETVLVTITQTVYTATTTAVHTASCGPVDADGGPGAIPRHHGHGRNHQQHHSGTRTRYTTHATTAPGTWTRTSFHCSNTSSSSNSRGRMTAGVSRPHPGPTPARFILGSGAVEAGQLQAAGAATAAAAAATKPPAHPPSPANPTRVTSTVNIGG